MSLADDIANWIRTTVHEAKAQGVAVGLSGGVDSSVVASLAHRGMPGRVLGAILPIDSDPQDAEDALLVASALGIETIQIDLSPTYRTLMASLPPATDMAAANVKPRLRMTTLYYLAASRGYLVCGSSNRSEVSIGYFTKHGDGAVDLLPIAALLKYEVRQLARDLGLPQRIIDKPPTAGLWPGQTDEAEMGFTYGQLDLALRAIERKDTTAMPGPVLSRVRELMRATAHKRMPPPIFIPRRQ